MKRKDPVNYPLKHSTFYLASMQTTRILLLILLLMTVGELLVFYLTCQRMCDYTLPFILESSKVFWISRIGCFLYCMAMIFTRINRHGSEPVYTLARLNMTRTQQWVENYIYNLLCVLILWGCQVMTYFGMYQIFIKVSDISVMGRQLWALMIYHTVFLKSFMPVFSLEGWVILVVLLLATPIIITDAPRHARGLTLFIPILYLFYVLVLPDSINGITVGILYPFVLVICERSLNYNLDHNTEKTEEKGGPIERSVSDRR